MSLYVFDGKSLTKTHWGEGAIFIVMILGVVCLHLSKSILRRSEYEEKRKNKILD